MSQYAALRQPQPAGSGTATQRDRTARFLAQAEAVCRAHAARLTPIRRRVLEALYVSAKPLGAYDLAAALASAGRRMAPITVYRALDFLIEQGLAHRLASQNAYIASVKGSDSRGATAFLICEACGTVNEASSPGFAECMTDLLRMQGFRSRTKFLEVTGWCSHCQAVANISLSPAPSGRA